MSSHRHADDRSVPADPRGLSLSWPGRRPGGGATDPRRPPPSLRVRERYGEEKNPGLLVHGDNRAAAEALLPRCRGAVNMVYIDPPFATGADFRLPTPPGGEARSGARAYRDGTARGLPAYLTMMEERLRLIRELLAPGGALYVHLDYRAAAPVRLLLDSIFGPRSFVNEIIWYYKTGGAPERLGFGRKHDNILFYVKDPSRATWNPQKEKSYLMHRYGFSNVEIHEDDHGRYTRVRCRDVFDIPALRGNQPERVDYPTQKPEALLERMILASTDPGDLVMDLFCGSGTAAAAAARLGRRWIACDRSPAAIRVARKRLLTAGSAPSFRVLDLGGADRARRAEERFGGDGGAPEESARAYRGFLLDRYGAAPAGENDPHHGRRGSAAVRLFGPAARPGATEVRAAAAAGRERELHLLAWEFAPGAAEEAERLTAAGPPVRLVPIPFDLMDEPECGGGAIPHRPLPALRAVLRRSAKRARTVRLEGYGPPAGGAEPDRIDQWAVDWEWDGAAFAPGWTAADRGRKGAIPRESDPHAYAKPGRPRVLVRAVDPAGTETHRILSPRIP